MLNRVQEKASDRAFTNPFKLIQGPPGNIIYKVLGCTDKAPGIPGVHSMTLNLIYDFLYGGHLTAFSYRYNCSEHHLFIGTGKSETGVHIAYTFAMANRQLSPRRCVLYCGPSNKSVDVVLGIMYYSFCIPH